MSEVNKINADKIIPETPTKIENKRRFTYKEQQFKEPSIKFVSASWSYLISGCLLFTAGLLDYFLLGHLIGHPGENAIGEYVGQGIAVFLGGISFFYTVGLIPLIIGAIFILYSVFSSKIVILAKNKNVIKIQEQRLLFPSYAELVYEDVQKIEHNNLGLKIKNAWILLFIPMAVRILQFGIPLFGEHRAADEILPTMMVITALIDIAIVFLLLLFPNHRINFHQKDKIFSLILFPLNQGRSYTLKLQQLLGLECNAEVDENELSVPKNGDCSIFNSGNSCVKDVKNLFKLGFGLGLIVISLIGLMFEMIWGTDLAMVGISYGIWLVINALKKDFSNESCLDSTSSISENKDITYSTSFGRFFSHVKLINQKEPTEVLNEERMRNFDLIDVIGIGLLLYLSTLELTWSWMFLSIFNWLILLDLIISTLFWLILMIFIGLYLIIPLEMVNVNKEFPKFSFRIYDEKRVLLPPIGLQNFNLIHYFKDIPKFIRESPLKNRILIRMGSSALGILAIILFGIFSV